MIKVSVYGIGYFGFALLKHLSQPRKKKEFVLYGYDNNAKLMDSLRTNRTHLIHHRSIKLSPQIKFADSPEALIKDTDVLVLAVTSTAIKEVLHSIMPFINRKLIVVNTAKALENESGMRFSEIIKDSLAGCGYPVSIAMLAGGTIAYDLFKHEPLGIDMASQDEEALVLLKKIFSTDNLRVYTTTDLAGVEYAAAFAKVISILAGTIKGLGFSYGSQTHMISRAAAEVERLVTKKLNGRPDTFTIGRQCWGNDMWMSCTGNTRNRELGILLGEGMKIDEALLIMKQKSKTIEGINTLNVIKSVTGDEIEQYPILKTVIDIVHENKSARTTIIRLLRSNNI